MIIQWLSDSCFVGACIGCLYLATAAAMTLRFRGRGPPPGKQPRDHVPPVSILKPLHGESARIFQCLASFCRQRYAAPVQLVFGVDHAADAAVPLVRQLQAAFPAARIDLKVDPRMHGGNRKVSNLANIAGLADHDIVILADSDIEVDPDFLARIVDTLQQPGVGAVTCLYHGTSGTGTWARLAALEINAQFLPNVIAAVTCKLAQPCFGATIALRRDTLARIGGLEAFADSLADDYSMGEAVRALGAEVAISPVAVGHLCKDQTARQLCAHELRWARTIRSIDPVGHLGSLISHPFPLAVLAALTGSSGAVALAVLALLCRVTLLKCVERRFGLERQAYWLVPLRDLISFMVFVLSLFGTKISWHGETYRLTPEGTVVRRTVL
jgi:ceramide glucosyltransferase